MKKKFLAVTLVLFLSVCFSGLAVAGETATRDECVAKCKEAVKMAKEIGLEATYKKINDKNGPFVWKDGYVFCFNIDTSTMVAHPIKPALIGKMLMGIKDVNGKQFFVDFCNVAKSAKGEGWVDYMWPKPGERKPSPKITFVCRVPGESVAVGAGIYK